MQVSQHLSITDGDENVYDPDPLKNQVNTFNGYVGHPLAIRRVDVVAWSYGGVITRWYLANNGTVASQKWYDRPLDSRLPMVTPKYRQDSRSVSISGNGLERGAALMSEEMFNLPKRVQRMASLYQQGHSFREIAEQMGCSYHSVCQQLYRYAVITPEEKAEERARHSQQIHRLRQQGLTQQQIASQMGLSLTWVSACLRQPPPSELLPPRPLSSPKPRDKQANRKGKDRLKSLPERVRKRLQAGNTPPISAMKECLHTDAEPLFSVALLIAQRDHCLS